MTNNSHNSRQDAQGSTGRGATEPSQSGLRPIDMAGLYHEVRSSLMHFAARYFRRPQEIEDVVQEAFVKVIEAQMLTITAALVPQRYSSHDKQLNPGR